MLIADWSLQYQSARGIKVIFYLAFLQNEEALAKNVVYFRRKYPILPESKIIAPYLAQYIKIKQWRPAIWSKYMPLRCFVHKTINWTFYLHVTK